jgi:hypothetical protein
MVKTAFHDQARYAGRNQPVERLTGNDASPNVCRGRRIRLDLEEKDSLGSVELLEDVLQLAARKARPGRDREPRALEYLLGLAPGEKVPELVGADHEHRIVEPLGTEQLHGARVGVEANVVGRKGSTRQRQPILGGRLDRTVPGPFADEDDELVRAELLSRGLGEGDMAEMGRVERAPIKR